MAFGALRPGFTGLNRPMSRNVMCITLTGTSRADFAAAHLSDPLIYLSSREPRVRWHMMQPPRLACPDGAGAEPRSYRRESGKLYQRDEMYFSRRICGTGRPNSFSAAKAASTMFGLPHR
jgi:hypothetical protein